MDDLSKTEKVFTLHYEITLEAMIDSTGSQTRILNSKIEKLYASFNRISSNIEKLKTRESVQYECITKLNNSDKTK